MIRPTALVLTLAALAGCGSPSQELAPVPVQVSVDPAAQEAEIAWLHDAHDPSRERGVQLRLSARLGTASFWSGDFPTGLAEPAEAAWEHLAAVPALLGGIGPDDLVLERQTHPTGRTAVHWQQQVDGLPLEGSSVVVEVDPETGRVTSVLARVLPVGQVLPAAVLGADQVGAGPATTVGQVAFSGELLGLTGLPGLRRAWRVESDAATTWVDAVSGEVLRVVSRHSDAYDLRIEDDRDLGVALYDDAPFVFDDACDSDCIQAAWYGKLVYEDWLDHGRRSYDNRDSEMLAAINASTSGQAMATWTRFGPGWAVYDIVGHEWNHVVDNHTADLTYQDESGALDEALADLRGAYLDGNWTIGEQAPGGAIRDLSDPGSDPSGSTGCTLSPRPSHMDGFCKPGPDKDNGGVHTNSTIIGHAVYLMVEGGRVSVSNGDFDVLGQGWEAIEPLLWSLQVGAQVGSEATFADFADKLHEGCQTIHGVRSPVCTTVRDGLAAVGLFEGTPAWRGQSGGFGTALASADLDLDGTDEVLVGHFDADLPGDEGQGAVFVFRSQDGAPSRAANTLTQGMFGSDTTAGEGFGAALAVGDIDGDGRADLAVGSPLETDDFTAEVGEGCVMLGGGDDGLDGDTVCVKQPGDTDRDAGDQAGSAVALGDFDCDGFDDLALGAPGEDWGGAAQAGAVSVHYSGGTLPGDAGAETFTQTDLGYSNEAYDRFGASLAVGDFDADGCDDLAIAAPDEDWGAVVDTGAVYILLGDRTGLGGGGRITVTPTEVGLGDNSHGYLGTALAVGDFDDDGRDDLAASAPWVSVGGRGSAGVVVVLSGTGSDLALAETLDSSGVNAAEEGDAFGRSLAAGDVDGDGIDDLVVGSPSEDYGSSVDTGAVSLFGGGSGVGLGVAWDRQVWQSNAGGARAAGSAFGAAVTVGAFFGGQPGVAAGAPGADDGAGEVCVLASATAADDLCVW